MLLNSARGRESLLEEMTEVADEIDLNLALLDDIIVNSLVSFGFEEPKDEWRRKGM